jgi:glucose-1-phosphate adenylyltransferase
MRITGFQEKPPPADPMPDDPNRFLASMGIYVFNRDFLLDRLCADATDRESSHDFGKDIIPSMIEDEHVLAYPFRDRNTHATNYWRDVGTLDAYYEASMDLVDVSPELDMYDQSWTINTYHPPLPPPKTVFADVSGDRPRAGRALDSVICPGAIISGGLVEHSIVGFHARVNSWAEVRGSILFGGVEVGRHARIRRAIIDKNVKVPEGVEIGFDHEKDRANGFTVTESGIVAVPMDAFTDFA